MLELIIYLLLGTITMMLVTKKTLWFSVILILIWPFYLLYKLVEYTDGIKERNRRNKDENK
ncbi:hypothetical protein P9D39_13755 [Heyndrickxia oleronia]|uniref:Uncharacterized protein n=1 Tax=Heyndrickxia oleronia TaxID=38875 RepID=A0A8E2LDU2_9BACI|nr:hypothetical protein [Heyndrickxia oleronia]MEC1375367.1 hypothetical protein [Heyndrickxia oleronia]OOP67012.1 hypothetical protein BWZ43_17970 [Heyndrickxia oleronia]QQZ03133.1 hypothetical protein I5818_15335 [Heyndrickxia oleronia]GIN37434.1 hypothetical protein J19TS1_03830 [Heyndrickxia oleronia]